MDESYWKPRARELIKLWQSVKRSFELSRTAGGFIRDRERKNAEGQWDKFEEAVEKFMKDAQVAGELETPRGPDESELSKRPKRPRKEAA